MRASIVAGASNIANNSSNRGGAILGKKDATYTVRLNKCYFENNTVKNGGIIWNDSTTGTVFMNACSFYQNTTSTYASAVGSRGICGINNCAFQENSNNSATGASNVYTVNGNLIVANSSFRLYANSAVALWSGLGGTTYLVNSTMVNSVPSDDASKGVALKSSYPLNSYGHNVVSKFYEVNADTYSIEDEVNHNDVLNYSLYQQWHTTQHCIYWTKWNVVNEAEVRPAGFVLATPSRVEAAIDAFDSAASTGFKAWLESLDIDGKGHNALETDILGRLRQAGGASTIWPGSYERSGSYTVE